MLHATLQFLIFFVKTLNKLLTIRSSSFPVQNLKLIIFNAEFIWYHMHVHKASTYLITRITINLEASSTNQQIREAYANHSHNIYIQI